MIHDFKKFSILRMGAPLPCFTYLVHSDQHHLPSMIMFTQQITSLHAYSQYFLAPLSCFAYLAQCDHHHLTSSIIITQLPPVPCFVYHGQPYHHPSFLYHVCTRNIQVLRNPTTVPVQERAERSNYRMVVA